MTVKETTRVRAKNQVMERNYSNCNKKDSPGKFTIVVIGVEGLLLISRLPTATKALSARKDEGHWVFTSGEFSDVAGLEGTVDADASLDTHSGLGYFFFLLPHESFNSNSGTS